MRNDLKYAVLLMFFISPFSSKAQEFEAAKDIYLKEEYKRYYDRNAGVIIQKVTSDSGKQKYELALSVFSRSRSSDDFLFKSSAIVFEDKSELIFTDQVYINYFQEGKHQYSVLHVLTHSEMLQLQTKRIDYFVVGSKKNSLDKWQKENFLKACQAVEK